METLIVPSQPHYIVTFRNSGNPDHAIFEGSVVQEGQEDRLMFEFSFLWRGVWEGRIYFKDDEYWHEDLAEMNEVWNEIESQLKARIREKRPDLINE